MLTIRGSSLLAADGFACFEGRRDCRAEDGRAGSRLWRELELLLLPPDEDIECSDGVPLDEKRMVCACRLRCDTGRGIALEGLD